MERRARLAQDWVKADRLKEVVVEVAHRVTAYAAVALVVIGIAWALALVRRPRPTNRVFDRFQAFAVGTVLVAAVAGAMILASGGRPREDLHLIYGAIAIGVIPLARSFVGGRDQRRPVAVFLAFAVLGGVLFRLFTTG
jgi:hypothetical protein